MFAFTTPLVISSSSSSPTSFRTAQIACNQIKPFRPAVVKKYITSQPAINTVSMCDGRSMTREELCEEETNKAVEAGRELREQLDQMSTDRQELAEETQKRLKDMNQRLSDLMAKVREEIGMPPVADLPEGESPPATTPSTSNTTTATESVSTSSANNIRVSDDANSSASDEPYMDPTNFGYEATAGWQVLADSLHLPENEDSLSFRVQCDAQGCSLIELKAPSADEDEDEDRQVEAGVRSNFILSGPGYRVGFDPNASKNCCALIGGGESWTIGLSYEEIRHFKRLCLSLQKKMDRINTREEEMPGKDASSMRKSADGLFNIRISRVGVDCSVEHESKLLWAQAIGQPVQGQYCIRAIFMEGRKVELYWAPDNVAGILGALQKLRVE